MSSGSRKIQNDEQYQKSLEWLVREADELEAPDLSPDERERRMKRYNFVADGIQRYKRGQLVQMFPGLAEKYDALGWAYDVPDAPEDAEPPKVSEPPPQTPVTAKKWSFLDDDDD